MRTELLPVPEETRTATATLTPSSPPTLRQQGRKKQEEVIREAEEDCANDQIGQS